MADWETKLRIEAGRGPDWENQLCEFIEASGWVDYGRERSLGLDRTLHSLCKSNAGRFKSPAQAKLILGKIAEETLRPHERLEDPSRWATVTESTRDYLSVQHVFGKDDRLCGYGFILDEAGVVAKIKFHVNTKLQESRTLGRVDYESGEVMFQR
jgi:hypothetical protein